jgi:hypothetical protein
VDRASAPQTDPNKAPPAASENIAPPPAPAVPEVAASLSARAPAASPEPVAAPPSVHPSAPAPEPGRAPELPRLLDDDTNTPEQDDPLALFGSWTKLDIRGRRSAAEAAPPEHPESPAAPVKPAAEATPKRGNTRLLVVAAAIVAVGIAAWIWAQPSDPAPAAETRAPAATATATATAMATGDPAPSAGATATTPGEPAAPPAVGSADTSAPVVESENVNACMTPLFAKGTFHRGFKPDFSFVCGQTDPRRGAEGLKKQVVLAAAKRSVSDGMREWALLGWYELSSYAVMRARCCPGAPPLKLPPAPSPCHPVDKVLDDLGAAALAAQGPKDKDLHKAVKRYTDEVYCLVRAGGTSLFGHVGPPRGGEETAFRKTLVRVTRKR